MDCDVDELEDLDSLEDVSGVPTFRFMKGGKRLDEFSGANESKLLTMLNKYK